MITTFFHVKGIVHKEFVPTGQKVNSGFCCNVLRRLLENVRRRRLRLWQEQTLLHRDNAPSHTSVFNHQFLAKNKMAVIPTHHTPLIWHPVTSSYFQKMKLNLKGRRFDTIEEIQAESQRVIDTLIERDFQEAFQKLRRRWERCLHAGGNYFQGDGGR